MSMKIRLGSLPHTRMREQGYVVGIGVHICMYMYSASSLLSTKITYFYHFVIFL